MRRHRASRRNALDVLDSIAANAEDIHASAARKPTLRQMHEDIIRLADYVARLAVYQRNTIQIVTDLEDSES